MRVGVLHGGLELIGENATPPCQKLQIVDAHALQISSFLDITKQISIASGVELS